MTYAQSLSILGSDFKAIQLVQNKLLRTLNGTKIKDKVSISSMLDKFSMLSVNQLNAGIKLLEMWKALKVDNYPLKIKSQYHNEEGINTRADMAGRPIEIGKSVLTQKTSVSDAIHLWNKAPINFAECSSIHQVKRAIKSYVKSLPT